MKRYWTFVAAVIAAWVLGLAIYSWFGEQGSNAGRSPIALGIKAPLGERRPDFRLTDRSGEIRGIDQWDGQVVLINFWATWCPPCRREIPAFIEVRNHFHSEGFEIVGVAVDQMAAVDQFVASMKIPYPILVGQSDASEVSRLLGNGMGALPYSVLIDREGIVRFAKAGELSEKALVAELKKHL